MTRQADGRRFDPVRALERVQPPPPPKGSLAPAIHTSATFSVERAADLPRVFAGELTPDAHGQYLYGRPLNPTVHVLARRLAAMEDAPAAACTASGISAICAAALRFVKPGERILASRALYGGTYSLFARFLPSHTGIAVDFVDMQDLEAAQQAITPRTRMLYVETISNPTLRVADIPALARIARDAGAPLVVDNTFAPMLVAPMRLGADVVVHSLTKFINGASDALGGVVCASRETIASMQDLHDGELMLLGAAMDPRVAYEISMRLPHLHLRLREHARRALRYATIMQQRGLRVVYPGLESHPDRALLERLRHPDFGFGGMLGVDLGQRSRAERFLDALQAEGFGRIAVSLGHAETLMCLAGATTASGVDERTRKAVGVGEGYIRMAVGVAGLLEDREAALVRAIEALGA